MVGVDKIGEPAAIDDQTISLLATGKDKSL